MDNAGQMKNLKAPDIPKAKLSVSFKNVEYQINVLQRLYNKPLRSLLHILTRPRIELMRRGVELTRRRVQMTRPEY